MVYVYVMWRKEKQAVMHKFEGYISKSTLVLGKLNHFTIIAKHSNKYVLL